MLTPTQTEPKMKTVGYGNHVMVRRARGGLESTGNQTEAMSASHPLPETETGRMLSPGRWRTIGPASPNAPRPADIIQSLLNR